MEHSKEKYKNMRFFNDLTVVERAAYKRQQEMRKKQQEITKLTTLDKE